MSFEVDSHAVTQLTGALALARRRAALWLFALVLLGTIIWSIAEVGFNFWQLEPRLVTPLVLAVWLLLPWVRRKLGLVAQRAGVASAVLRNGVYLRIMQLTRL